MTRVDFYFNAGNKVDVACKLAAKVYQSGQRALLYASDEVTVGELDATLWTRQPLSFIPHVRSGHPLAKETPIVIGTDAEPLVTPDVLVNLSGERPSSFSRFQRLIELVGRDPADRQLARQRYRFYQERGYEINNVDLDRHG